MTAIGRATVRRIATTAYVAAVLAVVLQAALPPPAVARESGGQAATNSERPARESRSASGPSEDLNCLGLSARDIAELRDTPDLRAEIEAACRATEAMTYAEDKPLPFPLWVVVVAAVVAIAFSAGLCWYYFARGTDVPWFWQSWWASWW